MPSPAPPDTAPTSALAVRQRLVEALELDLVGPWPGHPLAGERLRGWERPSNWYLTGFLIPSGTPPAQRGDADEDDDLGEVPAVAGLGEEDNEDRKAARKGYFPSSMGLSFLVDRAARALAVTIRWGDYEPAEIEGADGKTLEVWQRTPRETTLDVAIGSDDLTVPRTLPDSGGLQVHVTLRTIRAADLEEHLPAGTRSASVFLVNRRTPDDGERDVGYVFQPEIEVTCDRPFVARADLSGLRAEDWDDLVADLHYADTPEYATGHGVSAEWDIVDGACRVLRTAWIPSAEVEKTQTVALEGVELDMTALGGLADGAAVQAALAPLVTQYRTWIEQEGATVAALAGTRMAPPHFGQASGSTSYTSRISSAQRRRASPREKSSASTMVTPPSGSSGSPVGTPPSRLGLAAASSTLRRSPRVRLA